MTAKEHNVSDINDIMNESDSDTDLVKRLRAEIKARDSRLAETDARIAMTEKQSAFRDAGIDPNAGPGALLFKTFDGEVSKDAVLQAAQTYGITPSTSDPAPASTPDVVTPDPERAANEQMDGAGAGAPNSDGPKADPNTVGFDAFNKTMHETGNRDTAMAAHFGAKLEAALTERRG